MSRLIYVLLVLIPLVAFTNKAQAQGRVTGVVKDEKGNVLPAVTVALLQLPANTEIKTVVSDKEGVYVFIAITAGKYTVSASSVGHVTASAKAFTLSADQTISVPDLILPASPKAMTDVTVQTKRPLIENKIDKMVVNVDASPSNAGATAMEVLEKSPGITVDRDGNISLKGKQGIIVLMDGKQTYLSGQDLANLLRNMPASQLDQIEIMTQPSARYDAAGNSGIINLRTKKNSQVGFNGSISLSYVQGRYPKSPNSFNFNYKKGKFNFFTNLSYSYWSGFNDQHLIRRFHNNGVVASVFDQQADQKNRSSNYSGRFGMDYAINKKTTIGFLINTINNPSHWENKGKANILSNRGVIDSFNTAETVNKGSWKNFGAAINFRRILDTSGSELTADADVIRYDTRSNQTSDNFNYLAGGTLIRNPFLLRANLPAEITIYSGRVDYTRPLKKGAKFEAGLKSSYVSTDNDARYTFYEHNETKWVPDNSRSNHFLYKENINAAYINYSRQYKKLGVQTGLRMENTISEGKQFGNPTQKDTTFKKNYTQLFPTAYFSYALNANNQFGLSYGRRVERPNYQDMNPFQYFLDQYTFRQGNPNLTPQFTHNVELTHIYRKALNTTLNYTYTTDILNDILKQNDQTKVTYQTKENVAKRRTLGLAVSYNAPVTKWWTTSVFVNVNNNHYQGLVNNLPLDVSLTSLMANSSQQFRFAKTWTAEVTGFYRTRSQETGMFLIEPMGVVSFGFGKQLLKNKASLKLSVTDPFYIQRTTVIIDYGNIDAVVYNRWDNRRVGLTFTYRFSKGENIQQRRKSSSAQEEQNRVGGSN
ncbi:TonB-dependent receptor [Segetibacter sp. 3557_3]|uniref:outer membrane beta-barrel protein n=1 Tax=Segetibacter sp. 3557_3 TaxID=2547429 RepID=UPI0010587906|nr:outer membrane beta-barrel protein [Segetibacter sp. 3557_3]TDH20669.1 TonB-dependent receptor [Segetibacter sp. 3557_3]